MINAKEELNEKLEWIGKKATDVVAILINSKEAFLKASELTSYELESLDFEYDNGYGTQNLFGVVLFSDNTWLDRYEYDGSEGWDYLYPPDKDSILR